MVGEPEAGGDCEREEVGEELLGAFAEQLAQVATRRDLEAEHEQRDRDREHAVAEGDDAAELDLGLVAIVDVGD